MWTEAFSFVECCLLRGSVGSIPNHFHFPGHLFLLLKEQYFFVDEITVIELVFGFRNSH